MDNVLAFDTQQIYSNSDGSARRYVTKVMSAALAAKTMEAFLDILSVDSNVQIDLEWEKGATADRLEDQGTLLDGSSADASVGVKSANTGSNLIGGYVRPTVVISQWTFPSGLAKAMVNVRSIFKPF